MEAQKPEMRKMARFLAVALVALAPMAWASTALAALWAEVGNAGDLPATAQVPAGVGALTSISGALGSDTDADMYRIWVTGGGTFSATTVGGASFDTQLFLFYSSGMGVYANDDSAGGLQSTLPASNLLTPAAAGIYYLAISGYDRDPESPGGLIFPTSPFTDVHGPTGAGGGSPISGWSGIEKFSLPTRFT